MFNFVKKSINSSLVYVGVHVRRGDHLSSWKEKFPNSLVGKFEGNYFNHVIDIFRSKYNGNGSKVVFLAASDDFDWMRINLVNQSDIFFTKDIISVDSKWVGKL